MVTFRAALVEFVLLLIIASGHIDLVLTIPKPLASRWWGRRRRGSWHRTPPVRQEGSRTNFWGWASGGRGWRGGCRWGQRRRRTWGRSRPRSTRSCCWTFPNRVKSKNTLKLVLHVTAENTLHRGSISGLFVSSWTSLHTVVLAHTNNIQLNWSPAAQW